VGDGEEVPKPNHVVAGLIPSGNKFNTWQQEVQYLAVRGVTDIGKW